MVGCFSYDYKMAAVDGPMALNELPLPVLLAACVLLLLCIVFMWRLPRPTPPFLEPTAFKEAVLVKKQAINHNTRLFRFALDHPTQRLGLPVGQHITFKCKMADGSDCFRPYTPVTDDEQLGHVDFVIKVWTGSVQAGMGEVTLCKAGVGSSEAGRS